MYYYGARYYDPRLARFVSADTIVPKPFYPQSLNRFTYAYNNPVRLIDLDGHEATESDDESDNSEDQDNPDLSEKSGEDVDKNNVDAVINNFMFFIKRQGVERKADDHLYLKRLLINGGICQSLCKT